MPSFNLQSEGSYVGRVWRPGIGPAIVQIRGENVCDVTTVDAPTMRDLLEIPDLKAYLADVESDVLCDIQTLANNSLNAGVNLDVLHVLAPSDLQAIKAAGVTFARSMIERVIEERAAGDFSKAAAIRHQIGGIIGGTLQNLEPGSDRAEKVKAVLIQEGLWSQYLEVGIGPFAEIFTKSQPMSAVGWGSKVGLHPVSNWNNPEPEIVLAVNSRGEIVGATLGNDVNLRDVEGRSALLLGKAKDNNASAAIGPFIRLFDNDFSLADVEMADIDLAINGLDGFELSAVCSMQEISRKPTDLVTQTIGHHHQYPDGFMLYLGSMFAPVQDRNEPGEGFTHKIGDSVKISTPLLGTLENEVALSTECKRWEFGAAALMRNLAWRCLV
jgi:fumarylacetoacetate (FAA) hydrolase family protein